MKEKVCRDLPAQSFWKRTYNWPMKNDMEFVSMIRPFPQVNVVVVAFTITNPA